MAPTNLLFATLALVVGIAGNPPCQTPPAVVATEAQDNSVLNLSKGQTLLIKLPVQMGTGFSWVRVGKANLVRDDGNSVTSDKTVKPGGVETQVFQLTALAPGTETLRYLYVQPWNRGAKPAKSFQLKVLIASD